jgi:hypothetical protein
MNSTTFSPSTNSNSKIDRNQVTSEAVDFQPHRQTLTPIFASLDQEMDLMIGSLNFHVGSLVTTRLSDPTRSVPSAEKTASAAISKSLVGSSSDVKSLVSFKTMENIEGTIEELDEIMENLDLGEPVGDFMICCNSTSDKSTDTWKTGLELHEDDQTIFSSPSSKINQQYQVFAIIGENSEEFDENNNPILNPANLTRGANHLAEGDTADSLATRAKVRLSADNWKTIKAAVDNGTTIPVDASKEVLLGYHYALHWQSKQLEKERSEIRKRRESVSATIKSILMKHAVTHRIQTVEDTTCTDHESTILSIQIKETSQGTSTHLSCQSMSEVTSRQRHLK